MTEFKNTNQFKSFGHLDIGIWNLIVWSTIDGKDDSSF